MSLVCYYPTKKHREESGCVCTCERDLSESINDAIIITWDFFADISFSLFQSLSGRRILCFFPWRPARGHVYPCRGERDRNPPSPVILWQQYVPGPPFQWWLWNFFELCALLRFVKLFTMTRQTLIFLNLNAYQCTTPHYTYYHVCGTLRTGSSGGCCDAISRLEKEIEAFLF